MNNQEILKKAYGLLTGIGFKLNKKDDGKYEIQNHNGGVVATGDLVTVYNSALYLSQDAKRNPGKYVANVHTDQMSVSEKQKYQNGLAMAKKLNQGK